MVRRASVKGAVVVGDGEEEEEDEDEDEDEDEEEEEEADNPSLFQWDGSDLGSFEELELEQPLAVEVSPPGMVLARPRPRLMAFQE
jgi:hypothetical protein